MNAGRLNLDLPGGFVPTIPTEGRWWSPSNEADFVKQASRGMPNKARAIALLDRMHIMANVVLEEGFAPLEFRDVDGKTVAGLLCTERVNRARLERFIPYTDEQLEQWFPEGWQRR